MPNLSTLSFDGGALTVKVEGYGPCSGEGTFAFPEHAAVWSEEVDDDDGGEPRWLVTVPLTELRELHAWLGKTLAQIDKSV